MSNHTQNPFSFSQLDPRPIGREANEEIFGRGLPVYGIEVTIPALAVRCVANLDHHGTGDTVETPAACTQALDCDLPEAGSILATVRCDQDSITAMAVILNRSTGRTVDPELVSMVDELDRLGPQAARRDDRVVAIARKSADFRTPIADRVAWVADLIAGDDKTEEVAVLVAARNREFDTAKTASNVSLVSEGRIAVVVSTHRFGTNLGYQEAPVVVAHNPEMVVNFKDPTQGTYSKFTICRWDSNTTVNLSAACVELNELETAGSWGGQENIKGSPQGVSSSLSLEEVVAVVTRYLG